MKIILLMSLFMTSVAWAQGAEPVKLEAPESSLFSFDMKRSSPIERKSVIGFPLLSYVVPGIGQFLNGQSGAGFVYSGLGGLGLATAISGIAEINGRVASNTSATDIDSRDAAVRRILGGMKTYDLAGSLSMYHTFRTAVKFRQTKGDFDFLPEGETTDELMMAPFRFSHLSKWTTIIPLTLGLGLSALVLTDNNYETRNLTGSDVLFAGGISYNAGVGEEAMFRGWMFPLLAETFGNVFWANVATSTVFAAAHISGDNPIPWPQFLAGYYFAWLVQKNGWSMSEAIFVHTWWDVIVFTAGFAQGDKKASIYVPIYQTQF